MGLALELKCAGFRVIHSLVQSCCFKVGNLGLSVQGVCLRISR